MSEDTPASKPFLTAIIYLGQCVYKPASVVFTPDFGVRAPIVQILGQIRRNNESVQNLRKVFGLLDTNRLPRFHEKGTTRVRVQRLAIDEISHTLSRNDLVVMIFMHSEVWVIYAR